MIRPRSAHGSSDQINAAQVTVQLGKNHDESSDRASFNYSESGGKLKSVDGIDKEKHLDELIQTIKENGHTLYDPFCTQLEHGVQTLALAKHYAPEDEELHVACFLETLTNSSSSPKMMN